MGSPFARLFHRAPCEPLRFSPAHLPAGKLFDSGGNNPHVSEWILQPAGAFAIKLIANRKDHFCARRDRAFRDGINLINFQMDNNWRSAERGWAACADPLRLIGQEDRRISDADLAVRDPAVGPDEPNYFFGSERALVKLDRAGAIVDYQVWHGAANRGRRRQRRFCGLPPCAAGSGGPSGLRLLHRLQRRTCPSGVAMYQMCPKGSCTPQQRSPQSSSLIGLTIREPPSIARWNASSTSGTWT